MKVRAFFLLLTLVAFSARASQSARRLNRYEYQCTIRDLLGVDFRAADALPADNFSYGFDNNAATLTMTVARAAIESVPPPAAPQLERYSNASASADITWQRNFAWDGDYDIHISVAGRNDPFALNMVTQGPLPKSEQLENLAH
jgi:Protein of unknown function (DUF1587)